MNANAVKGVKMKMNIPKKKNMGTQFTVGMIVAHCRVHSLSKENIICIAITTT